MKMIKLPLVLFFVFFCEYSEEIFSQTKDCFVLLVMTKMKTASQLIYITFAWDDLDCPPQTNSNYNISI